MGNSMGTDRAAACHKEVGSACEAAGKSSSSQAVRTECQWCVGERVGAAGTPERQGDRTAVTDPGCRASGPDSDDLTEAQGDALLALLTLLAQLMDSMYADLRMHGTALHPRQLCFSLAHDSARPARLKLWLRDEYAEREDAYGVALWILRSFSRDGSLVCLKVPLGEAIMEKVRSQSLFAYCEQDSDVVPSSRAMTTLSLWGADADLDDSTTLLRMSHRIGLL